MNTKMWFIDYELDLVISYLDYLQHFYHLSYDLLEPLYKGLRKIREELDSNV